MIGLADPLALLLTPLPLIAFWLRPAAASGAAAVVVPDGTAQRLAGAAVGSARDSVDPEARSRIGQRIAAIALWLLMVVALSGPRVLVTNDALPVSGRDLVLVFDLSGSMVREDFELDGAPARRLDALKAVATDFVRRRAGDRLALVVFGARAYFATPQTFDTAAVAKAIDAATIGISGRATAISEGVGVALKRLQRSSAASKVIVLLSDGANNSGPARPRDVAVLAAEQGVRIHTIAMGTRTVAESGGARDAVDAATLEAMAVQSGGTYFRVATTADLRAVADAIDALEATVSDGPTALTYRDLWIWPAAAAAVLAGALGWQVVRP